MVKGTSNGRYYGVQLDDSDQVEEHMILSPDADLPAGHVEVTISAITNRPLRYFIPSPLSQLIERYGKKKKERRQLGEERFLAVALARTAAIRGVGHEVDVAQAARFCRLALGRGVYRTRAQLMELGKEISKKNDGYRNEIIFAGAAVASEAKIIFAPYTVIPQLMEDLFEVASQDQGDVDPALLSAIAYYYGVRVHPFVDGNGRWARLMAASLGMLSGQSCAVMINVAFQNTCKADIADKLWQNAQISGLRGYLEASSRFEDSVLEQFELLGVPAAAVRTAEELSRTSRNARAFHDVMVELHSSQKIELSKLRALYGMSSRALDGLLQRLVDSDGIVRVHTGCIDISNLHSKVDQAVKSAKEITLLGSEIYAQ